MGTSFVRDSIRKGYKGSVAVQLAKEYQAARRATEPQKPVDLSAHWRPHAGRQTQFWESTAREVLYGGAAGGGKSSCLTAFPLKYAHLPGCLNVVFRRNTTHFQDLKAKSLELYPKVFPGLEPVQSPHFVWTLPSGATTHYRHCQHEKNVADFDGWEINTLSFDELTHFTEAQYLGLCARVRTSKPGYPTLIRATTNPGGEGHDWVFRRWGAWLNPDFEAPGLTPRFAADGKTKLPPALPGEVFWIRRMPDATECYFREEPTDGGPPALSRTFIPALIGDNPSLSEGSPEYLAQLEELDPVRRKQLRDGDWLVKPAAGLYFKGTWVEFIDAAPTEGILGRIRAWDLAGTENPEGKSGIDWTVGVKMAFTKTSVIIEDVERFQANPSEVRSKQKLTAELDGKRCYIFTPQDPGQAGKDQVYNIALGLRGWPLIVGTANGDKVTRFEPFSAYADTKGGVRKVYLVRGKWNKAYVEELEAFPTPGIPDDQVDATSDAFNRLHELLTKRRAAGGDLEVIETSDRA